MEPFDTQSPRQGPRVAHPPMIHLIAILTGLEVAAWYCGWLYGDFED